MRLRSHSRRQIWTSNLAVISRPSFLKIQRMLLTGARRKQGCDSSAFYRHLGSLKTHFSPSSATLHAGSPRSTRWGLKGRPFRSPEWKAGVQGHAVMKNTGLAALVQFTVDTFQYALKRKTRKRAALGASPHLSSHGRASLLSTCLSEDCPPHRSERPTATHRFSPLPLICFLFVSLPRSHV